MIDIENMFKYQGKTTKVIGSSEQKPIKKFMIISHLYRKINYPMMVTTWVIMSFLKQFMRKNIILKNLNNETVETLSRGCI